MCKKIQKIPTSYVWENILQVQPVAPTRMHADDIGNEALASQVAGKTSNRLTAPNARFQAAQVMVCRLRGTGRWGIKMQLQPVGDRLVPGIFERADADDLISGPTREVSDQMLVLAEKIWVHEQQTHQTALSPL
jgi:hypothetical protein